jgi:radical SAM protein with 4Fe4S-binding SPASM domain
MERSLDIEITRRCNLRCDYCFVGWSRDWTSDLPRAVAEEVIREGAGRFDLLHITGGEPFARRDLFDLLDLGMALGYPAALVNTNGTMISEADVARLAGYGGRVALSVSFDGPPALHDGVRGEGRFAEADRTVSALLAASVPVTVMTVVTPAVLAVLPSFLAERRRTHPGLAGITLFPVGVGPEGSQKPGTPLSSLTPGDIRTLASITALAFHAGLPITVGAFPMINPLLTALGMPAARLYQCSAGRGRVCVHADGGVSSCHPVKEPIYGQWSSGLFDRLPDTKVHAALAARDFDGCRDCSHREGCGHCRAFVTAAGVDLLGNDLVCHDVVPGRREAFAANEVEARRAAPREKGLISPASLVRHGDEARLAVARRFTALLGTGRFEEIDELVTPDCLDHNPLPFQPMGRDGVCWKLALWRAESPLARTELLALTPTDEGVEALWETFPAPDKPPSRWRARFVMKGKRIRAYETAHVA